MQNMIAKALVDRIKRAIADKTRFQVVVMLPWHPEGSFDSTATRTLHA